MKHFFVYAFLISCFHFSAQVSVDSLQGFDTGKAAMEAHANGFFGAETKVIVNYSKREFIKKKFNLYTSSAGSKYSSNTVANTTCMDIDFESFSPGPYSTSSLTSWTVNKGTNTTGFCTSATVYNAFSNNVYVYATPVTDANCNNVSASPLGGNNVIAINKTFAGSEATRLAQTFSVTNTNCYYYYAYLGVLMQNDHQCCAQNALVFNFYDCAGNLITPISSIIKAPNSVANCSAFNGWVSNVNYYYTSNWMSFAVNLIPYIGSCITVEVIGMNCVAATHSGYCYYDAKCSSAGVVVNGNLLATTIYTSCASTATIIAPPGFSSYSWQGPTGSGVSSSTNSFVTTTVSGNYSFTAVSGTTSVTQTINLTVPPASLNVSIASPSGTLCNGQTLLLQATGGSLSNYTWSAGSAAAAIVVSPSVTTVYSVSATNSLGCTSTDVKTITVLPSPLVTLQSSAPAICVGQTASLTALGAGATSYSWSTGSNASSLTVNPIATTVYTLTAFNAIGCTRADTKTLVVNPLPTLQIGFSSPSICDGQTATITANASSIVSYSWSNGASSASFATSPLLNTVYSVTVTNNNSCTSSTTNTLQVLPGAHLQLNPGSSNHCKGYKLLLSATGNSLNTFMWNVGATTNTINVSPALTTVYSVTVTNIYGCQDSGTLQLTVLPSPQIQVSATPLLVCNGQQVTFNVTGNTNPSPVWSNGATGVVMVATPSITTVFTASVTGSNGCVGTASQTIQVHPISQVTIIVSTETICLGETIELIAGGVGVLSYTWNTGSNAPTLSFTPQSTTAYSITGIDANGCKSSDYKLMSVDACLGINSLTANQEDGLVVFPNPTADSFSIKGTKAEKGEIVNDLGQVIGKFNLTEASNFTCVIKNLAKGIYFVRANGHSVKVIVK